ncbi:hypothetical protein [Formosa haliotis]|uniref:hypothetical protein n=1 Tax=Formosa haliotis TaxID=1555194 RepID=UPI00082573D3|nr:hypothetical protein [Formosa haliotis]
MKRLILIFVITSFFISCSSDDDNDDQNKAAFNPPAWIQGTWEADLIDEVGVGVKFKADDYCNIVTGNDVCFKTVVEESLGLITVEDEQSTDTEYKFTIKRPLETTSFHYKKKSDTSIVLVVLNIDTVVYDKK